jgi:hypothetical protein
VVRDHAPAPRIITRGQGRVFLGAQAAWSRPAQKTSDKVVRLSLKNPEMLLPCGPLSVLSIPMPTLPGAARRVNAACPPRTGNADV